MAQDIINNSLHVNGALSCREFNAPPGSISDSDIEAAAAIDATKLIHQFPLHVAQVGTVTAVTTLLHVAQGDGEIVSIEAVTPTVATGADRTVTIDLQKSTGGGAFATVLTTTLVLDNTNTARVAEAGTINTPDYVDGDVFQLVVTVAGAAGSQASGLLVTVTVRENPQ